MKHSPLRALPALMLAAAMFLASGCGSKGSASGSSAPAPAQTAAATTAPAVKRPATSPPAPAPVSFSMPEDGIFSDPVWRADYAYADMTYEHYTPERFDDFTAPVLYMAENGGTPQQFEDAANALTDELYYVLTLDALISLRSLSDPADEALSEELLYTDGLAAVVSDAYWQALHTLAVSPNGFLLYGLFTPEEIHVFEDYEPVTEEGLSLAQQEQSLENEYYRIMASDEPDPDALTDIYLQLVELRKTVAELAGYDSFSDYAYRERFYRDYGPAEMQKVWNYVKRYIAPLAAQYRRQVAEEEYGLYYLGAVDCRPEAILSAAEGILTEFSGELYRAFCYLLQYDLYDISFDLRKANLGFTISLDYYNEPFIFNAPYDDYTDYTDFFHEFGHFSNAYYTTSDLLFGLMDEDLSELQGQGMEIMMTHWYDRLFGNLSRAARNALLMTLADRAIECTMMDEFQQRVYELPPDKLDGEQLNALYALLYEEYGLESYPGYELDWLGDSQAFEVPFYSSSYTLSAVGALELYRMTTADWEKARKTYLTLCAMDTEQYYLSEALRETGMMDVFSADSYAAVAEVLRGAWE